MKKKTGTRLLGAAALAVAAVYGVNRLAFWVSIRKNILVSGQQNKFSWRFSDIYYTKKGKGSPVLLLHGMDTGSSAYEWKAMLGSLAENHTVYAIDLPGYGRSDKERMLYTNYLYVDAVTAFTKQVIGQKTDLVTSGDSSSIAVMAAHLNPDLFGSIVMIAPETPDEMIRQPLAAERVLSRLMMLPLFGTFAYVLQSSRLMIKKKLFLSDPGRTERDSQETAAAFWEGAHLGGPDARFQLASRLGAYTRVNVCFALKKIGNPLCIIYGSGDPGAEKTLDVYRHFHPGIREVKIQNAKKRPHLSHPGRIAAFSAEFFRDHEDAGKREYFPLHPR